MGAAEKKLKCGQGSFLEARIRVEKSVFFGVGFFLYFLWLLDLQKTVKVVFGWSKTLPFGRRPKRSKNEFFLDFSCSGEASGRPNRSYFHNLSRWRGRRTSVVVLFFDDFWGKAKTSVWLKRNTTFPCLQGPKIDEKHGSWLSVPGPILDHF